MAAGVVSLVQSPCVVGRQPSQTSSRQLTPEKGDVMPVELVPTRPDQRIEELPEPPRVVTREQIEKLESQMFEFPQLEIETRHHFASGLYAREITIPKGALVTGKVHRAEHLNIVSAGRIIVWTEDGMREVSAPFTMVSRPGTKRVGLALEDTVWTTIHANETNERDLDNLEAVLVEPIKAIDADEGIKCLG